MYRTVVRLAVVVMALMAVRECAFAGTGEGIMPYETWLATFQKSVTGPVAAALIIIGIVGAGAMLIWGGEIGTFLKTMVYLTLVACFIVGAASLYEKYFKGDGYSLRDGVAVAGVPEPAKGKRWL